MDVAGARFLRFTGGDCDLFDYAACGSPQRSCGCCVQGVLARAGDLRASAGSAYWLADADRDGDSADAMLGVRSASGACVYLLSSSAEKLGEECVLMRSPSASGEESLQP